ncbi:MAG: hypothetical protein FRX49_03377 [Trebouxia sp. A1-2]|nr:MAG: hypothetical protein FRX49_03377 [Trebouxia sp. A1-2]
MRCALEGAPLHPVGGCKRGGQRGQISKICWWPECLWGLGLGSRLKMAADSRSAASSSRRRVCSAPAPSLSSSTALTNSPAVSEYTSWRDRTHHTQMHKHRHTYSGNGAGTDTHVVSAAHVQVLDKGLRNTLCLGTDLIELLCMVSRMSEQTTNQASKVSSETSGNTQARKGRQLYLACFILKDLLLFPARTEFLLQLFNSNLHHDKTIDWLGSRVLHCQRQRK